MRMSCNGCRVLRKRCSESCILRPCLEWIKSEESQANATVFLAKFYGRTGLINLISNGPQHSRPALFRSLLYEACGRLSNPIYGAVGLLCSGNWELCQAGVDSILDGSYLADMANKSNLPNIRDDQNEEQHTVMPSISSELHKVNSRGKFKSVNHRKRSKSKELQLLKNMQISSDEAAKGKGFDIIKALQDNCIVRCAKDKCSQQQHDLVSQTNCNPLHTINPKVDALYDLQNCGTEMEVELTLGASSPPTHKLAD